MARGKRLLDGSQRNQVVEMVKAGKDVDEVVDFMKQTYDVAVDPKFIKKLKKGLDGGEAAPGKRKYTRRGVKMHKGDIMKVLGVSGEPRGKKALIEVAEDPDCVLVAICIHAKICTPEICKFRKA